MRKWGNKTQKGEESTREETTTALPRKWHPKREKQQRDTRATQWHDAKYEGRRRTRRAKEEMREEGKGEGPPGGTAQVVGCEPPAPLLGTRATRTGTQPTDSRRRTAHRTHNQSSRRRRRRRQSRRESHACDGSNHLEGDRGRPRRGARETDRTQRQYNEHRTRTRRKMQPTRQSSQSSASGERGGEKKKNRDTQREAGKEAARRRRPRPPAKWLGGGLNKNVAATPREDLNWKAGT